MDECGKAVVCVLLVLSVCLFFTAVISSCVSAIKSQQETMWQDEIVRRGYGEIVVTDEGRVFQWKGENEPSSH